MPPTLGGVWETDRCIPATPGCLCPSGAFSFRSAGEAAAEQGPDSQVPYPKSYTFWTPPCSGKGIAFKTQVCYDKITRSTVRKSIPYRKKKSPAIAWKAGGSAFLYGSGKVPSQGISSLWMSSSQKESSAELPQATLKLASCWLSPKLSARREPFRAFSAFAATWAELSAPS